MFILYLALWVILNGRITPEILIIGAFLAAAASALTARLRGRTLQEEKQLLKRLPLLICYAGVLAAEIVKASFAVMHMIWNRREMPDPVIVEFRSGLQGSWRNVLLANSITLTPGTYTVFQEGDRLVVHSLCPAYAEGIADCVFVRMLRRIH